MIPDSFETLSGRTEKPRSVDNAVRTVNFRLVANRKDRVGSRLNWRNSRLHVRREKALVHCGRESRPGTGSLHPEAIGAAVEETKPSEPPV